MVARSARIYAHAQAHMHKHTHTSITFLFVFYNDVKGKLQKRNHGTFVRKLRYLDGQ